MLSGCKVAILLSSFLFFKVCSYFSTIAESHRLEASRGVTELCETLWEGEVWTGRKIGCIFHDLCIVLALGTY